MWPPDQTARTRTIEYTQANGVNVASNLNPNAKEFYPSHLNFWRLKGGSDIKVQEIPRLETYTITEGPEEKKIQIFQTKKGLVDVTYNSCLQVERYETRTLDTKIHINLQQKSVKINKIELQRNIPQKMPNNNVIRKNFPGGSNGPATSLKTPTVNQLNANVKKLNSGLKPPTDGGGGATSKTSPSVTTKSKLINPKLDLKGTSKVIPSNRDCISIKSSTSSDKSSSSINNNSTSNRIATTKDKANITRPTTALQNKQTSLKSSVKSIADSQPKHITVKPPRGTVASTLRKTENQKRRNLFPFDPVLNIEMSEFLFK